MYILDAHDQFSPLSSSPRPMSAELHTPASSVSLKRKRGAEGEDSNPLKAVSAPFFGQIPLPTPAPSFSSSFYDAPSPQDPSSLSHPMSRNRSLDSRNSKRLHLNPKPRFARHVSQPSSDLSSFVSFASQTSPTTTACHVCQRRPSTRQDLPGYLDCEVCGLRTCFVCMRTCEGPQCQSTMAHRSSGLGLPDEELPVGKRICSGCCVEVGSDGRVWCTACYQDDTELEIYNPRTKEALEAESASRIADWLNRSGAEEETFSEPSLPGGDIDIDIDIDIDS